jgi:hypothetical protein
LLVCAVPVILLVCAVPVILLVCAVPVILLVCAVLFNMERAGELDNGREQIPMKIKYKIVE